MTNEKGIVKSCENCLNGSMMTHINRPKGENISWLCKLNYDISVKCKTSAINNCRWQPKQEKTDTGKILRQFSDEIQDEISYIVMVCSDRK
jgi:hypothetical protein